MSFLDDLVPYTDLWGLIHNVPQDKREDSRTVSQNGLTYTAEAVLILKERGELTAAAAYSYAAAATDCFQVSECLLFRHPKFHRDGNQISIDCVAGFASLSALAQYPRAASGLLNLWGMKQWSHWSRAYNPDEQQYREHFGFRAWFGKYPALIAALEYAAGRKPPLWRRVYFGLAMRMGSIATHDGARVARLLAACHPDSAYWLGLVNTRIKKEYGSLSMLYASYFQNPEHVFARYAPW